MISATSVKNGLLRCCHQLNTRWYTHIRLWAFFLSILLSLLRFSYRQPINPDGILYLKTAHAFLQHGLDAAIRVYHWPFYSLLIGVTSKALNVSLLASAYLLNTILDAWTVVLFITVVSQLYRRVAKPVDSWMFGESSSPVMFQIPTSILLELLSAFLVLFFPFLAHYRDVVIRDHGFYVFTLLGLLGFLKYSVTMSWSSAFWWGISIVLATLFRIEGAVLALLVPLVLLFRGGTGWVKRVWFITKAHSVLMVVGGILFAVKFHRGGTNIGLFHEIENRVWELYGTQHIIDKLDQTAGAVWPLLSPFASLGQAKQVLVIGLLGFFLISVITLINPVFAYLSVETLVKKEMPWMWAEKATWFSFVTITVVTWVVYLGQKMFLTRRSVALLCFLLLMLVPWKIVIAYREWGMRKTTREQRRKWRSWLFPLAMLTMVVWMIDSVAFTGPSQTFQIDAAVWLKRHSRENAIVCVNRPNILFYAERGGFDDAPPGDSLTQLLKSNHFDKCDYAAIVVTRHYEGGEKLLSDHFERTPVKRFENNRNDKVFIFSLEKVQ
ncbi:MAG: hypothetical protein V3S24_07770 [Candidatus Tectomicrobia bacterium]